MNKRIRAKGKFEIEVKRFYLPVKFDIQCPHCGAINPIDLESQYLSYPTVNKKESEYRECDHCDKEFEFDIKVEVGVEIDMDARKIGDY